MKLFKSVYNFRMYMKKLFNNITIKQANIITIGVVFLFSLIFIVLLVQEMYMDYEQALEQATLTHQNEISPSLFQEQKKEKLKSILIKTILSILTLTFLLFAIGAGFYKILSSIIKRDTEIFLEFFKSAAHDEKALIPDSLYFKDFRVMVGYINDMLETITAQKSSLVELNAGLEYRVEEKTADLLKINENLQNEKTFSNNLLKAQKEFLRYTVHETNTPLSVILTSIELYTMKNKKDRQLSKIEAAVKNISSIYDDLSYLIKKDQIDYPKTVLNIEKYIKSRIDFFDEVAEHSLIKFEYTPRVIDAHIYFNETKLQRVVDNTITNAIKYTLPNETVYVQLHKSGAFVEFSMGSKSKTIQNTQKVFDAYYRESEEENDASFGLGLKLVHNICEEEGVIIDVSSDEEQTVFKYRFMIMGE